MKTEKIRFADNLANHIVTIEGRTVRVHCIGWQILIIDALPQDDIQTLQTHINNLIKGTPAGIDDVRALLELAL